MEIGKRIANLRSERGLTQKDLADKLFVTPQAISRWENDNVEPGLETLKQMATIFNVSLDVLLDNEAPTPVETKAPESQPLLGICGKCGRAIYKNEKAHDGKVANKEKVGRHYKTTYKSCLMCDECYENHLKAEEAEKQRIVREQKQKAKKRFVHSLVWGSILAAIVLGVLLGIGGWLTNDGFKYAYIFFIVGPVASILCFETMFTLINDNTFVTEMFYGVCEFGFVKFPGVIFSFDLGGLAFLVVVKIIFIGLGFLFMAAGVVLAFLLSMLFSSFMFIVSVIRVKKAL